MTLFVSLGWVGIGLDTVWPVIEVRLLVLTVGIVVGGMVSGWQQALRRARRTLP